MLWNTFLKCNEGLLAKNLTAEIGSIRTKIQELIFKFQGMGDQNEWHYDTTLSFGSPDICIKRVRDVLIDIDIAHRSLD